MQQVLDLTRRIAPYTFHFLTYFPLQTFPAENKVQILASDDEKTQLKKWLYDYMYKTSLDVYRQNLVRSRMPTQADLQTAKTLSSFRPPQAEEKKAREYVEELKLNYELLRGLSEERVLQILTTGYLKPLHRFQDYDGNFVRAVLNLRSMEQNSKTPVALKYAQSFSLSPEKLREYLGNANKVLKEWESFNRPKSNFGRIHSDLVSRLMQNLSPKSTAALKAVSKTISKAKVIKWKAVVRGNSIEEALEGYTLKQITHLTINNNVNDLEYLKMLSNLDSLVFGIKFNQLIGMDVLPDGLEKLEFNYESQFNQPIGVGVLPKRLKSLRFGYKFNHPIEKRVLPDSLVSLEFDYETKFNHPIGVEVLPKGLKSLMLGGEFDHPIGLEVLPKGLKNLRLGLKFNQPIGVGVLPAGLKSLTFGWDFNQPIGVGVLPNSLESLDFGFGFNQPIGVKVLPNSLKSLKFRLIFNQEIGPDILPEGLKSLEFLSDSMYNKPIEVGFLPNSLEVLDLGTNFNHPIGLKVLPYGLKSLKIGARFNQPIVSEVLPTGLKSLEFVFDNDTEFNWPSGVGVLPDGLESLKFKGKFKQSFQIGFLPPGLKNITFVDFYDTPIEMKLEYHDNFGTIAKQRNF